MSSNPLSINPPPGSHISSPSHPSAFPSYACPPFLSTTPFRGPLPFGSLCNRSLNIASMSSSRFELCSSPPPSASSSSSTSSCRCAFCRGDDVGGTEDEDEEEDEDDHPTLMPERWDVVGPGQAMVDFSSMVDDEFLEKLGLDKGTRKVVNHEERGKVLGAMDGCSYKAAAGGSLSNSLVALARLGNQPIGHALSITMAGSVGSDPLGGFIGPSCVVPMSGFCLPQSVMGQQGRLLFSQLLMPNAPCLPTREHLPLLIMMLPFRE